MMLPALLLLLAAAPGPGAPPPLSLQAALGEASARGPAVLEARARQELARGEVTVARALDPFVLSVGGGGNDPRWSAGVSQRLVVSGARGSRVAASEADAQAAALLQRQALAEARSSARKAYFALLRARQLTEVARRSLSLALQSEQAARLRFETGAAPELDLVQASLARASVQTEVVTREGEQLALSAELAQLLGRAPELPLAPSASPVPALPPLETVLARARQSPGLLATRASLAGEEARLEAARQERWPAINLGVGTEGDGPGGRMVAARATLDFEFPLFGFNQGAISRARAAIELARTLEQNAARGRSAQVLAAHRRLEAALRALALYPEELLPDAERVERMALEAYGAGRSTLTTLNDARRAAADIRTQAIEAEFNAQTAFAELELAAGGALDEN
ncbi:TolC family protein [Archangium violaceum]|uniref:TolC family protein n=1 Tax=Archangium violaceum TaxID=83451 RepID=UPI002B30417E|nr:TolC family protein [Archangium gephyra]